MTPTHRVLIVLAVLFAICCWAYTPSRDLSVFEHRYLTPDQRYGCTPAQQAPNGECK